MVKKLLRFNPDLMVAWPLSVDASMRRSVEALGCFGETNDALPVEQEAEQMQNRLCPGELTGLSERASVEALR
ncbi:hypothetical protein [Kitasatospora sp. NPDC056531]|uniref:hypothetical protein n=1 Tax=Kitasatospora sp. NPDC056531 TaxID=3345856 RepID=UPI0036CDF17E